MGAEGESVGAGIMAFTIEYVIDPAKVLAEINRVMHPGSKLIIISQHHDMLNRTLKSATGTLTEGDLLTNRIKIYNALIEIYSASIDYLRDFSPEHKKIYDDVSSKIKDTLVSEVLNREVDELNYGIGDAELDDEYHIESGYIKSLDIKLSDLKDELAYTEIIINRISDPETLTEQLKDAGFKVEEVKIFREGKFKAAFGITATKEETAAMPDGLGTTEKEKPGLDETLFPEFYSLDRPTLEGLDGLAEELSRYPELKPQLTFFFRISENRRRALEMIKSGEIDEGQVIKLLGSDDFIERDTGIYLLYKVRALSKDNIGRLQGLLVDRVWDGKDKEIAEQIRVKIILETKGDEAFNILKGMCEDEGWEVRKAAAQGLGTMRNRKALKTLKKLCRTDKSSDIGYINNEKVMEAAANARVRILLETKGEKAFKDLKNMFMYPGESSVKLAATKGFVALKNKKVLSILIDDLESGDFDYEIKLVIKQSIRDILFDIAKKEGEKALPVLKGMLENKNSYVQRVALHSSIRALLENRGSTALPDLSRMFPRYEEEVEDILNFEINGHKWLLATQKPMFATPYTKELIEGLLGLEKISWTLKEEFGDKFVGILIYGSASKGYFKKTDFDCVVIAEDKKVSKRFQELVPHTGKYEFHHHVGVDENNTLIDIKNPRLFSGIFMGDRSRLVQIQNKFIESIDEKRWDRIRENNVDTGNLHKIAERFGINSEELERIEQSTILLRTPPTYPQALKTARKNTGTASPPGVVGEEPSPVENSSDEAAEMPGDLGTTEKEKPTL